jgi:hypothetical protein
MIVNKRLLPCRRIHWRGRICGTLAGANLRCSVRTVQTALMLTFVSQNKTVNTHLTFGTPCFILFKHWIGYETDIPLYTVHFTLFIVHHERTIQINQPTICISFTGLLLDVYVWLNMFRALFRPSSGAYKCTRSVWFYCWREAAGELLVVVWQVKVCHTTTNKAATSTLRW